MMSREEMLAKKREYYKTHKGCYKKKVMCGIYEIVNTVIGVG
jgi:hypothetical protein